MGTTGMHRPPILLPPPPLPAPPPPPLPHLPPGSELGRRPVQEGVVLVQGKRVADKVHGVLVQSKLPDRERMK